MCGAKVPKVPFPATDIWWSSLETCSKCFTYTKQYCHLALIAKSHTIGKPAVYILLEFFPD